MRGTLQCPTILRLVDADFRRGNPTSIRGSPLADKPFAIPMQRRRQSKITNPMTPIGPVPFVGRQGELAELKQHLAVVSLVSLHGALGSGKTRLVAELALTLDAPCTVIDCHPGDRASALRAR